MRGSHYLLAPTSSRSSCVSLRPAASVAVARPSLDEVYLRHTGRRYSESETADRNGTEHKRELVEAGR